MYLIVLAASVLLIAVCHLLFIHKEGRVVSQDRVCALLWSTPFVGVLCALAFLYTKGWLNSGLALIPASVSLLLGGCLTALRPKLVQYQNNMANGGVLLSVFRDILLLCFAACISVLFIEVPWNDGFWSLPANMLILNFGIVLSILVFLYFLGRRSGALVALGVTALLLIGIAQYYIGMFKQSAILPSDLMALGTAAAVGAGYDFVLTDSVIGLLPWYSVVIVLLGCMVPVRASERRLRISGTVIDLSSSFAILLALIACYLNVSFTDVFGCTENYWDSLAVYKTQGFLPSFISLAQTLEIDVPDGYSLESAEQLEKQYAVAYEEGRGVSEGILQARAQFENQHPAIVAIMNESYADMSVYNGLDGGYEGAAFPRVLSDGLVGGKVLSSVYGGGTCNSEFEFLTGVSMTHIGFGKLPYTSYNLANVDNLPKQLSQYGYTSTVIHPNTKTNWNRNVIYEELGFDEFLGIEDFDGAEWYHAGISDAATYAKVLDILRAEQGPQFIFDITMQNHGGYTWNNIPQDQLPSYAPRGVSGEIQSELNEYIACINKSDAALGWFLDELRTIGRPVIVVFFGDHQPGFANELNWAAFGESWDHGNTARIYQTPYFIWSNYDVAGFDQATQYLDTNISSLASQVLEYAGVPLSTYQKASLTLQESLSFVNVFSYRGDDGIWYSVDDEESPNIALLRDRSSIQYRHFAENI